MPAGARGEHHEQRPQPLPAAGDDVLGHLIDERHGALEALADHTVHRAEVRLDRRTNLFQGHGTGMRFFGMAGSWGATHRSRPKRLWRNPRRLAQRARQLTTKSLPALAKVPLYPHIA